MNYLMKILVLITCLLAIVPSTVNAQETNDETSKLELANTRISLNHASVAELSVLKGVGRKKAEAIVAYRDTHGQFESLEELLRVKGIGDAILNANRIRLSL